MKRLSNFYFLLIFISIIGIVITISIVYKTITLFNNASFTSSSYNLLVISKNAYLINIDTSRPRLNIIDIKNLKDFKPEESSVRNRMAIGIPYDGYIYEKTPSVYQNITKDFFSLKKILNIIMKPHNYISLHLNPADLLRIYLETQKIPRSEITSKSVGVLNDLSEDELRKLLSSDKIINEKTSIEIINASGVDGLGSKVSQMLKVLGCNVISVISQDTRPTTKLISRIEKNSTVSTLSDIFELPIQYKEESAISDVTIILGENFLK